MSQKSLWQDVWENKPSGMVPFRWGSPLKRYRGQQWLLLTENTGWVTGPDWLKDTGLLSPPPVLVGDGASGKLRTNPQPMVYGWCQVRAEIFHLISTVNALHTAMLARYKKKNSNKNTAWCLTDNGIFIKVSPVQYHIHFKTFEEICTF